MDSRYALYRIDQLERYRDTTEQYTDELSTLYKDVYNDMLEILKKTKKPRINTLMKQYEEYIYSLEITQQHKMSILLKGMYERSFYETSYNIALEQGYGIILYRFNEKQIDIAIKREWTGNINYSTRIHKDMVKLQKVLRKEMTLAIVSGEARTKTAKRLQSALGISYRNAKRLAITESAFVTEQATYESYKKNNVKSYVFLSTLDKKTSKKCASLDLRTFELSEAVVGVNYPPMHPNCRSTTITKIVGKDRIARDDIGKNISVPATMTYKEWYNKFVEPNDKKQR